MIHRMICSLVLPGCISFSCVAVLRQGLVICQRFLSLRFIFKIFQFWFYLYFGVPNFLSNDIKKSSRVMHNYNFSCVIIYYGCVTHCQSFTTSKCISASRRMEKTTCINVINASLTIRGRLSVKIIGSVFFFSIK